jgi:predicted phage terminase large subunit-like protein
MAKKPVKIFRDFADESALQASPAIRATTDPAKEEWLGREMSLTEFVREAWHVIEPGTELEWNWHIDAICMHLEAVADGRIQNLLISIPPGSMKSVIVSVMYPAWLWTRKPSIRVITASYAMDLGTRDSVKTRDIILSSWYKDTFRPGWVLKGDQNVKTRYQLTAGGGRQVLSVDSMTTGFRGDGWIVDDPLNATDILEGKVNVADAVDKANNYVGKVLSTRINDIRKAFRIVVMQRLHENDVIGFLEASGEFELLSIPMEFNPEERFTTSIGWTDPRSDRGQLMFPRMFPKSELQKKKGPYQLGPTAYEAQYNQNPVPSKGDVFDSAWFRTYIEKPRFLAKIISVDCTFKDKKSSDYVVIDVWGANGQDRFLIEQVRKKLSFTATRDAIRKVYSRHPDASAVIIEDAANGPAIIDELRKEIPIIVPITPLGSKYARAMSIQPIAEAGCIYIPGWWSEEMRTDWLKEISGFPKRSHDDRVDTMSQAITYMRRFSVVLDPGQVGVFEE